MEIRRAEPSDARSIAQIIVPIFREVHGSNLAAIFSRQEDADGLASLGECFGNDFAGVF
jgi:hypothetical protein